MRAGIAAHVQLSRHPQSTGAPSLEIGVDVERDASVLALTYRLRGNIVALVVPKKAAAARADGLWQHTCFEAFLRSAQSKAYWEFNLSPSREWAAYRFDCYREGMAPERAIIDPHIEVQLEDSELRLSATVDLSGIEALAANNDWRVGLSAVIEDQNGGKSYWALAHPDGKPDFHHAQSFVLALWRGEN